MESVIYGLGCLSGVLLTVGAGIVWYLKKGMPRL